MGRRNWTEDERRTFNARFQYFREALAAVNTRQLDILPEEALLLWLKLYPFEDLSNLSASELKKSVAALWEDIVSVSESAVKVESKGLVVHPAAGHQDDTLVNGLLYAMGDSLSGINGELRLGIVHRIDKDPAMYTIQVGLKQFKFANETLFAPMMAGATISALPMFVMFFALQKYFMEGVTIGAVKG